LSAKAVIVLHAAERAAQRGGITVAEVRADVVDALAAGRCGTKRPHFLGEGNDARPGRWFVWDQAQTRAFLFEPRLDGIVRVITTPTPWRGDFIVDQGDGSVAQAFERAREVAA